MKILLILTLTLFGSVSSAKEKFIHSYCGSLERMWNKYKDHLDSLNDKQKIKGWNLKAWYDANCK